MALVEHWCAHGGRFFCELLAWGVEAAHWLSMHLLGGLEVLWLPFNELVVALTWRSKAKSIGHWHRLLHCCCLLLAFTAEPVGSWLAHQREELSIFALDHLCHGLVQEVVGRIARFVPVLPRSRSSSIRAISLINKLAIYEAVPIRREVIPCWALVHDDGVVLLCPR